MVPLVKITILALLWVTIDASRMPGTGPRLSPVEREAMMREMEEEATKHSIVTYNKASVAAAGSLEALEAKIKEKCNCNIEHLASIGAFKLNYDSSDHLNAAEMLEIPDISHASEDLVVFMDLDRERQSTSPNDPKFSDQWALQIKSNEADINAQEGWQTYMSDSQGGSPDGPNVIVAVIDTGIDYTHPDIADAMWQNPDEIPDNEVDDDNNGIVDDVFGADFTSSDSGNPIDRNGHGTHCAGVIAAPADNGVGIAGIAGVSQGKAKLMAIKGLSDQGSGSLTGLMQGLNYAISKGAKISSNSWGGGGSDGGILADILSNNPEHLFIAAAGNDNEEITENNPSVTCSTNAANQICVGSTTESDSRSWFSNYGKPYVHVMAPGSDIMSTIPNSQYAEYSGTSMACPQVSGLAALVMTMRSGFNAVQLKQLIEGNVQQKSQYSDFVTTGGLIDILATVQAATGDQPQPTTTTTSGPNPPGDDVCTNIKIVTQNWGNENSWTFGSCSSAQTYGNNQEYTVECCQPAGSYNLTCLCSFGDGWHGGYMQIGDSDEKYCEDFESGDSKVIEDVAQGMPEPPTDDVCVNVKTVTKRWGDENSWIFGSCASGQSYEANEEYNEECCQPAGSYEFICKCSFGDGWHDGYVQIGDSEEKLCEDFDDGDSKTIEDVAHGGDSVPDVCVNMKLTTKDWGNEIAWTYGSCSSKGITYTANEEYDFECCQPAGTYEFDCKDSYGDGWHGGQMEIGVGLTAPSVVCQDFQDGHSQKQDVVME